MPGKNTALTKQGGIGKLSRSGSYKAKQLYKAKKHTGIKAAAKVCEDLSPLLSLLPPPLLLSSPF